MKTPTAISRLVSDTLAYAERRRDSADLAWPAQCDEDDLREFFGEYASAAMSAVTGMGSWDTVNTELRERLDRETENARQESDASWRTFSLGDSMSPSNLPSCSAWVALWTRRIASSANAGRSGAASKPSIMPTAYSKPELVFGLVGALGAKIQGIAKALRSELQAVGYKVPENPIKLSALMHEVQRPPFSSLFVNGKRASIEQYMDAGTSLRRELKHADALALYAVRAIRGARSNPDRPEDGTAFILDSLKHDGEVETLRRIYGPAFISIGVYTPYHDRKESVQKRLFDEKGQRGFPNEWDTEADRLIDKDEEEKNEPFGQHVSEAFALCDIVVNTTKGEEPISRFIHLLFGDWTKTPTRDEVGMYHAQGAAYQSSSMARQVGAAICRNGAVIATGTNEVPRYGGGLFDVDALEAGSKDPRDFKRGYDTSDQQRREVLVDLLERLCRKEIITSFTERDALSKADEFLGLDDSAPNKATDGLAPILKRAKFMSTIDYTRAVHAETAAITACALSGTSTAGTTLYVTTFPCHDCAKHIIAAGISRVVYIEPYMKSLAKPFFEDLIALDEPIAPEKVRFEPFVGVTPRRFAEFFMKRDDRKNLGGRYISWQPSGPRLPEYFLGVSARTAGEKTELDALDEVQRQVWLEPNESTG